ncbi:hypothetical protein [Arenivirga flava]|nr:hypothetical protein [Arenivirga flava]
MRQERMARAVLSAGVGTLLTAAAHSVGGGAFPAPLVLALVFALSVLLSFALAGRRVTVPWLLASVGATQLLLHAAFTATGDGATLTGDTVGHAHHAVAGIPAGAAAHHAVAGIVAGTAGHHEGMLWAHVAAGLVTVASMRLGAGALRRALAAVAPALARRIALALSLLRQPVLRPAPVRAHAATASPHPLVALLAAAVEARRGPPSAASAR